MFTDVLNFVQEADLNLTVDDSLLMADPLASMSVKDLDLKEIEDSLEMAEVDHLHSGKTELSA